jgi:hypothetical protein
MKALCAISLLLLIMSQGSVAAAHGVVGDYVFLEPLVAEDPTPANELDLAQPGWVKSSDANDYSVGFGLEKVVYRDENDMPRFSLSVATAWHHISPIEGSSADGFENLELGAKWAFFYSLQHEFLTSVGLVLQVAGWRCRYPRTEPYQSRSRVPLGERLRRPSQRRCAQIFETLWYPERRGLSPGVRWAYKS